MRVLLAALCLVAGATPLAARPVDGAASGGAANLSTRPAPRPIRFDHLGSREGLSQSTVMAVLQDSQGFMWFATENGVNRFDGYAMRTYRRDAGSDGSLASDFVWALAEDRGGDVWMATVGGGVARWVRRTDRFEHFRHDPRNPASLGSDAVRSLAIDRAGRVWAGTEQDGLTAIDPARSTAQRFVHAKDDPASLPSDAVFALHEDRLGRLWIGTDAGLAVIDDPGAARPVVRRVATLGALRIRTLGLDRGGDLWIGTFDRGVLRYSPGDGRTASLRHDPARKDSLSGDHIRSILQDDEGRLWIATSRGLDLLDMANLSVTRYVHDKGDPGSLRDSYAMSLYQDRAGLLWVGTRAGGVSRWSPRSWQLGHVLTPGLRDIAVTSITDDGAGHAWVGTAGGGLLEMTLQDGSEGRRWSSGAADAAMRLSDDRVMSLLHDRGGKLWVGTMNGGIDLLGVDGRVTRRFRHSASDADTLGADGIMTLFEDRAGTVWAGTFGGGIARYDAVRGVFRRVAADEEPSRRLSDLRASAIVEDRRGALWVGTTGGGLNLIEPQTGRVHHYRHRRDAPDSLGDDTIYALHVDAEGTVWIGTAGGGLSQVVGDSSEPGQIRFRSWRTEDGLPSDVVYGVRSDSEGKLWLSTNYGIARLEPRSGAILVLHDRHGLQAEEFNYGAHHRSKDGRLFFGGNNGFNAFDPAHLRLNGAAPAIVLTSFETLNRPAATAVPHWLLPSVVLGHRDSVATFEFAALDFAAPERNRYDYKLEGFDKGWVNAGTVRRVSYTNLDPGEYTFRVRAAGADGVWNENGLALPVTMKPPPWASPGAKLAYAVLAVLLLGGLVNAQRRRLRRETDYSRRLAQTVEDRTRELQERNHELEVMSRARSQFVARMSHELRTPMNGVVGMTEVLLQGPLDQAQRRCAEIVKRAAASLVTIVDDILDLSKAEAGRMELELLEVDIEELVESVADTFAARALDKGVELIVDAPTQPTPWLMADAGRLRQVLNNLVGNAVKFTDRGRIIVGWSIQADGDDRRQVTFSVRDTGVGILAENLERVFEPFAQEQASTHRRYGGTGLGLSIAREFVALMGGTLKLQSEPGRGTEFSFELPLAVAPSLRERGEIVARRSPEPGFAGRRALLIGAVGPLRALLERHLIHWGIAIATEEGPAAIRAADGQFDVVLRIRSVGEPLTDATLQRCLNAGARALIDVCDLQQSTQHPGDPTARDLRISRLVKPIRVSELQQALVDALAPPSAAEPDRAGQRTLAGNVNTPRFHGRVLLVEDQAMNRAVAAQLLGLLGLQVTEAADGTEALDLLEARDFDLVLMDCQMPRLDGFETTRRIRASHLDRRATRVRLPIVALTADATAATRTRCLESGMDRVLTKPITQPALIDMLAAVLGQGAPRPSQDVDAPLDARELDVLRSLPGGVAVRSRILGLYRDGSTTLLARMGAALDAGDMPDLARAAHAWRSYNGNIGARALEQACRELEEAALAGNRTQARATFGRLGQLHRTVAAELDAQFPEHAA